MIEFRIKNHARLQDVSAGIAKEYREELKNHLSPRAEVVARNQEAKRHELDNRMRAIVCEHEADIAKEVWRTQINGRQMIVNKKTLSWAATLRRKGDL